jgi:hypothetical protein
MLLNTEGSKDGISKDSRSYKDTLRLKLRSPMGTHGKATFLARLEEEVGRVKAAFPQAHYVGLSDGEKDHWNFPRSYLDTQLLDFWHATGYLRKTAEVMFQGEKTGPSEGEMALKKRVMSSSICRVRQVGFEGVQYIPDRDVLCTSLGTPLTHKL